MKYNSKFLFLLILNLLSVAYFYNMEDVGAQDNKTAPQSSLDLLGKNEPLFIKTPIYEYSISNVLNDSHEVIDWHLSESIIAVKAELDKSEITCFEEDCFDKQIGNAVITVNAFIENQDNVVAKFPASELYKFVHIPSKKWEGPAIFMDVKFTNDPKKPQYKHTKSSMCNTYIELGKLYKCNITIK
jgi:hypothetical protein